METVTVTLKHAKAKKLLQDLEEMDIIQVNSEIFVRKGTPSLDKPISALKDMIQTPMSEAEIDQQLEQLRNEWERNF